MTIPNMVIEATCSQPFAEWANGSRPDRRATGEAVKVSEEHRALLELHSMNPNVQPDDGRAGQTTGRLASLGAHYGVTRLAQIVRDNMDDPDDLRLELFVAKDHDTQRCVRPALWEWDHRGGKTDGGEWIRLLDRQRTAAQVFGQLLRCEDHVVIRHALAGSLTVLWSDRDTYLGGDDADALARRWRDMVQQVELRLGPDVLDL